MAARLAGAVVVLALAMTTSAHAQFTGLAASRCNSTKLKATATSASALLACLRRSGDARAECAAKVASKFGAPATGPFAKADATGRDCIAGTTGNQAAYVPKLEGLAADVTALLATPTTPSKCDGARLRCVAKYLRGSLNCVAKFTRKLAGSIPPTCLDEQAAKLSNGVSGCWEKATEPCANATTAAAAKAAADRFVAGAICNLFPSALPCTPDCGNLFVEPSEPCDGSASLEVGACGAEFACTDCNCACPTALHFRGDATAPATLLDAGWSGRLHRSHLLTGGDVSAAVSCGATSRPCGTCAVTGLIPNGVADQLRNRRCSNDTSIQCADDAACGAGTCEYFLGGPLPLESHGFCLLNQFRDDMTGTVDVESGEMRTAMHLLVRVGQYPGAFCPTCDGDGTPNDGLAEGMCSSGPKAGLSCDVSGSVPGRPNLPTTSLDCPPDVAPYAFMRAALNVDFELATETVTKSVSEASPRCKYFTNTHCLCDVCNNPDNQACAVNGDCPDPAGPQGPGCGIGACIAGSNAGGSCVTDSACPGSACRSYPWRRCTSGSNANALCAVSSECPGSFCSFEQVTATRVNACGDDSSTPFHPCVDSEPIDDEGTCQYLAPATFRCVDDQRLCSHDVHCGGAANSCIPTPNLGSASV